MIALPALTQAQVERLRQCVTHLEALLEGFTSLSSKTHMCEHRDDVVGATQDTLNRMQSYVQSHSTLVCRRSLGEEDISAIKVS